MPRCNGGAADGVQATQLWRLCVEAVSRLTCFLVRRPLTSIPVVLTGDLAASHPGLDSVDLVLDNGATLGYARRKIAGVLGVDTAGGGRELCIRCPWMVLPFRDAETLLQVGINGSSTLTVSCRRGW